MKIANAGGFWGDDSEAPLKLVQQVPDLDYLTLDYLAELSLSILAGQKEKDPSKGYAADFIEVVKSLLPCWESGAKFKIVTNAGGLNPLGLKTEIEKLVPYKKVLAVTGDDVLPLLFNNKENPLFSHLETGATLESLQSSLVTANAYLGAGKIVQALQAGADIVVTGRIADPSLTVGPAHFHFGWKKEDYQKLAQATIAGHLIECGTQVTGGISHCWNSLDKPWEIGFPVVEMEETGDFIITKPLSTNGRVDISTVKEQLVYEIGDPSRYLSPDVTVSFLQLKLEEVGTNRVKITGALGRAPSLYYKVSATFKAGWRGEGTLVFYGEEARRHAKKAAAVILKKVAVERSNLELYGDEGEVLMRLTAADSSKAVIEKFIKQFAPLVTSGPPGTSGYTGGRGKPRLQMGYWPCLIERSQVDEYS